MQLLQPKSKRRLWIPGLLFLGMTSALVWAIIHGNWSPALPEPTRSSEGVRCGYESLPDGGKAVKCAFVVDKPMRSVKGMITDYNRFDKLFPYLRSAKGIPQGGDQIRFVGTAHYTSYDSFDFEVLITHHEGLSDFTASWDSPSKYLAKNKGNWNLHYLDSQHTLVTYTLELQVKGIPSFIIRNLLIDQVPQVAEAAKKNIEKEAH